MCCNLVSVRYGLLLVPAKQSVGKTSFFAPVKLLVGKVASEMTCNMSSGLFNPTALYLEL